MPLPDLSILQPHTEMTYEPIHRSDLPQIGPQREAQFRDAMRAEGDGAGPGIPYSSETRTDENGRAVMDGLFAQRVGQDGVRLYKARAPVDQEGRPDGSSSERLQVAAFGRGDLSPGAQHLLLPERPTGGFRREELPEMSPEQETRFGDTLRREGGSGVAIPGSQRAVHDDAGRSFGEQGVARRIDPDCILLGKLRLPLDAAGGPAGPGEPQQADILRRGDLSPSAEGLLLRPMIPGGPIPLDPAARKTDNDQQIENFKQAHPQQSGTIANNTFALGSYAKLSNGDPGLPLLRELAANVGGGARASENPHVKKALQPDSALANKGHFAAAVDRLQGREASRIRLSLQLGSTSTHVLDQMVQHQPAAIRMNAQNNASVLRRAARVIERTPGLPSLEQLARRDGDPRQDADVQRIKHILSTSGEPGAKRAASHLGSSMNVLRATYRANPTIASAVEAAAGPSRTVEPMSAPTPPGFDGGPRAPGPSGSDHDGDEDMPG